MRIDLRRINFVFVLLLGFLLALPGAPAGAAISNCGVAGNWHVGRTYNPIGGTIRVRGASADIEVEQASLCTTDYSTSWAWSMVYSDTSVGWAQIGYIHKNDGAYRRFIWQWTEDGSPYYTGLWGSPILNAAYQFKVSRYMTDGKLHMLIDGSIPPNNANGIAPVTNFDPTVSWYGLSAGWYGEITNPGSDYPGTDGDRVDFFNVQSRDQNGNWVARGFTSGESDFCYGHYRTVSDSNIEIWTDPLNHNC